MHVLLAMRYVIPFFLLSLCLVNIADAAIAKATNAQVNQRLQLIGQMEKLASFARLDSQGKAVPAAAVQKLNILPQCPKEKPLQCPAGQVGESGM